MKLLTIEPLENERQDEDILRSCKILRTDEKGRAAKEERLWFQFPAVEKYPDSDDCDSYLLAMFMEGMEEGRKIVVKGSVSGELLSNLVELQSIWNKWVPERYGLVDIEVDHIRESGVRVPGAVCAFSGGVDGSFTVWRHSQSKCSYRSQKINFCSLVHGFDIPLADADAFENALKRAEDTLEDIDLTILPIRTNYREITKKWTHKFSIALAAVLGNFKSLAGSCMIGSSEPYNSLVIPWGSSPITDHLLSSGEFVVIHDGASHSRTEKVAQVAEWKKGINNLRVCWQGELKDRNCGQCEKCVRTKLNFLACNLDVPECFPESVSIEKILQRVVIKKDAIRAEWQQILDYADRHKVKASWKVSVRELLGKKRWINLFKRK